MPGRHAEYPETSSWPLKPGVRSSTITIRLDFGLWSEAAAMARADDVRTMDWIEGAIRQRIADRSPGAPAGDPDPAPRARGAKR